MTRDPHRILAAAICVIVAAFLLARSRTGDSPRRDAYPPDSPSQEAAQARITPDGGAAQRLDEAKSVVYAALDAAEQGDVAGYLRCFSGPKEDELEALAAERGEGAFSDALKRINAGIRGIALYDAAQISGDRLRITCETLYENHNERQIVTLQSRRTGWRIVRLENLGAFKMPTPLGGVFGPSSPPPEEPESPSTKQDTRGGK